MNLMKKKIKLRHDDAWIGDHEFQIESLQLLCSVIPASLIPVLANHVSLYNVEKSFELARAKPAERRQILEDLLEVVKDLSTRLRRKYLDAETRDHLTEHLYLSVGDDGLTLIKRLKSELQLLERAGAKELRNIKQKTEKGGKPRDFAALRLANSVAKSLQEFKIKRTGRDGKLEKVLSIIFSDLDEERDIRYLMRQMQRKSF